MSREQGDCVTKRWRLPLTDIFWGSDAPRSRIVSVTKWLWLFSLTYWGSHCPWTRLDSVTVWLWLYFSDILTLWCDLELICWPIVKKLLSKENTGLCDCIFLWPIEWELLSREMPPTVLPWLSLADLMWRNHFPQIWVTYLTVWQSLSFILWGSHCPENNLDCVTVTLFSWLIVRESLPKLKAQPGDCMTVTVFLLCGSRCPGSSFNCVTVWL